jgi:hypothetical protein
LLSFAGLPENGDVERARTVLLEELASDPQVLRTPPRDVFVDRLDSGEAMSTAAGLHREVREKLTAADAEALAPRRIWKMVLPDSDPSRLMAQGTQPE